MRRICSGPAHAEVSLQSDPSTNVTGRKRRTLGRAERHVTGAPTALRQDHAEVVAVQQRPGAGACRADDTALLLDRIRGLEGTWFSFVTPRRSVSNSMQLSAGYCTTLLAAALSVLLAAMPLASQLLSSRP